MSQPPQSPYPKEPEMTDRWTPEAEAELLHLDVLESKARAELSKFVHDHCPGPHRLVQHRDGRPPWCKACRRNRRGGRIDPAPKETA